MIYGSKAVTTHYQAGAVSDAFTTYSESVRVSSDEDVLAEFLKLMEYVKKPGRFNPVMEIVTDRRTNQPLRIVKTWSEI